MTYRTPGSPSEKLPKASRFGNGYLIEDIRAHRCDFPGRFTQWCWRLKPGRQWICATCKTQFTLMQGGAWTLTNFGESYNDSAARINKIIDAISYP